MSADTKIHDTSLHSSHVKNNLNYGHRFVSLHQNIYSQIANILEKEQEKIKKNSKNNFYTELDGVEILVESSVSLPDISKRDVIIKNTETNQLIVIDYDLEKNIILEYQVSTTKNNRSFFHFRYNYNHSDNTSAIYTNVEQQNQMIIKLNDNKIKNISIKSRNRDQSIFQAKFNSTGELHSSNGPAIKINHENKIQELFYFQGKQLSSDDLFEADINIQKSRNQLQARKNQAANPPKKRIFSKKKTVNSKEGEENLLLDRMILFDKIDHLKDELKIKLSEINNLLKIITNIFEEENEAFYGTVVYDENDKEIIITKELINQLDLYSMEAFAEKYQEEYFTSIKKDVNRLEKALTGILSIIAKQTDRPIGVKLGNPTTNLKNKHLKPLSQNCVYINKNESNNNLRHMEDEEGLVYIMNSNGTIDNKAMIEHLTVEDTFTNDDLKDILIKLENDIKSVEVNIENINENVNIVKQHIQEHQIELKKEITQLLNSEEGAEEDNYFSASLKSEY